MNFNISIYFFIIAIFTNIADLCIADSNCSNESWLENQSVIDTWIVPAYPNNHYYGYGPFGFWIQPTSCTDVVIDSEGNRIEYTKRLVCVPDAQVKIISAPTPEGGGCTIAGRAIPDPYFKTLTDPCAVIEHLPPHPSVPFG